MPVSGAPYASVTVAVTQCTLPTGLAASAGSREMPAGGPGLIRIFAANASITQHEVGGGLGTASVRS
jgi:hypothetical protein